MRALRTRENLGHEHMRLAPRNDLDVRNQTRLDAVRDEIGESLLSGQRIGHAANGTGVVLDADDQRASRRVGESDDGAQDRIGR